MTTDTPDSPLIDSGRHSGLAKTPRTFADGGHQHGCPLTSRGGACTCNPPPAHCPKCGWSRRLEPGETDTCQCGLFTFTRRRTYEGGFRPAAWAHHDQGEDQ